MNSMPRNLFTTDFLTSTQRAQVANVALTYAKRMHEVAIEMRANSLDKDKIDFGSYYSAALSVLDQMDVILYMIRPLIPVIPITLDLVWLERYTRDAILKQDWYKLSACTETLLNTCEEAQAKMNKVELK